MQRDFAKIVFLEVIFIYRIEKEIEVGEVFTIKAILFYFFNYSIFLFLICDFGERFALIEIMGQYIFNFFHINFALWVTKFFGYVYLFDKALIILEWFFIIE
jgi:hypothetical protein